MDKKKLKYIQSGFTLIELIAAVVIMGILAMVAVKPKIVDYTALSSLSSGSQMIKADLRRTRSDAMQKQIPQMIVFDIAQPFYTFFEKDTSANIWVHTKTGYAMPSSVKVAATTIVDNKISFDIYGKPYEGDPETAITVTRSITLSALDTEKNIQILPETGYVF
ncbi:MAG: prepilin-type N-terminal cleavage/methylation domain-containing protein [bacterium]|nr:prepilin-type N-terminal cleavage/methylation domain-containing protein [bacterium]